MSINRVLGKIMYHKRTENILNDLLFTLDFKNSDSLVLPLGTVISANIDIDVSQTEKHRSDIQKKSEKQEATLSYVGYSLAIEIDCSFIPEFYRKRIEGQKDIICIRLKPIRFSNNGMCQAFPDSFIHIPPDYLNKNENMYQSVKYDKNNILRITIG